MWGIPARPIQSLHPRHIPRLLVIDSAKISARVSPPSEIAVVLGAAMAPCGRQGLGHHGKAGRVFARRAQRRRGLTDGNKNVALAGCTASVLRPGEKGVGRPHLTETTTVPPLYLIEQVSRSHQENLGRTPDPSKGSACSSRPPKFPFDMSGWIGQHLATRASSVFIYSFVYRTKP